MTFSGTTHHSSLSSLILADAQPPLGGPIRLIPTRPIHPSPSVTPPQPTHPYPNPHHSPDPEDRDYLLGERCALAYMQADALQHRAMTLLAEFDARSGFKAFGFSSTACWLAWRIGITPGAARERGADGPGSRPAA